MADKKKRGPLYTHIETGKIFELVKTKPLTLVPAWGARSFGEARRPTKITFSRDYQKVNELS